MQPIERPARRTTVLASICAAVLVLAACNRLGNEPSAAKSAPAPAVKVQSRPAAAMEPVEDPIQAHASQAY